jgi:DNA-binding FadR family transcriptional regulator
VANALAADLRRRIVTGDLGVGTRLPPEPEMRERFAVSRATLRSAFRVLESEGLLKIHRGARGGAEVTHPPAATAARYFGLLLQTRGATLADFQTARQILEPPLAAGLAVNADEAAVARLREALDIEERAITDPDRYGDATVRFHELVAELSGSATLWVVMDLLHGVLQRHTEVRLREEARTPELRKGHRAHVRLVELVEAGDAVAARSLWQAHVEEIGTALLRGAGRSRVVDLFD